MDVFLTHGSARSLPTEFRVQVIVHGGTTDFDLWPGPGEDRNLKEQWGEKFEEMLVLERKRLLKDKPQFSSTIRMQPGRLHCDYLLWSCTRDPEPGIERSAGLRKEQIQTCVRKVLEFVSDRRHLSIAMDSIGNGPGELSEEDRIVYLAEEAHRVEESFFAKKKPFSVEKILICSSDVKALQNAKRRLPHWVRLIGVQEKKVISRIVSKKSGTKKTSSKKFSPEEITQALRSAALYDRTQTYQNETWLIHPKFGLGKIIEVGTDQTIVIRFENGQEKKLIHAR